MPYSVVVNGVEIEYTDAGSGPTLVFVHGAYVTGAVWDDVVARLSPHYRCIVPTWPFGAQIRPVGAANLGVLAAGRRIFGLLDALELNEVTLIANDIGGGVVVAAIGEAYPDGLPEFGRVSRLVFTNSDTFEAFPPRRYAPTVWLCGVSEALGAALLRGLATRRGRAFFASAVTKNGIDDARVSAMFGGFATTPEVRREAARFTGDLLPRYTLAAKSALKEWSTPVLIAWGADDKMFPSWHARRLAEAFPRSSLRTIGDSSTYVMLDQPDQTATAISEFVPRL